MKSCIEVLKDDQALLIFPEGARTLDGEVKKFETGAMLIIKRAKPAVVPVAVEGPYNIWPRKQKWPKLRGRMGVMYGKPISGEMLASMKADEAMSLLQQRVVELREDLKKKLY